MPPTPPVLFTAFANPHGDLAGLNREQNGIQAALAPLEAAGAIKHLLRNHTDLNAYFDFLREWENRIVLFHYAGHANSSVLALQNAEAFFQPLAEELLARNRDSLQLIFLNGCSTHGHVQTLFDLGAPAVIATSAPVGDDQATQLAIRFYENLAKGDTIEAAYKSAANFVRGKSEDARFSQLGRIETWRGPVYRAASVQEQFPWGLYVREGMAAQASKALLELRLPRTEAQTGPTVVHNVTQNAEKIINTGNIDTAYFS